MGFAKGQRVQVKAKEGMIQAHVVKVAAAGVTLILDDWRKTKPLQPSQVQPSTAPVVAGGPGHTVYGKRDRVEFKDDGGKLLHGTVESGDMFKVKVVLDGGEMVYEVPQRELAASTKVLAKPAPSVMDDWGVRSYKAVPALSEETEAFTADITYKGKSVIKAKNDGHGGCNMYHGDRAMVDRFQADAKAWFDEANVEHLIEAADHFVTWHATLRPYAVDAMEHLREYDLRLGQAIHTPPNL